MTVYFPFVQPDLCERKPIRTTKRNVLGQNIMATRKMLDVYHRITYVYDKISTRQYRIINNFFRKMSGGVDSFYLVDWGDPRLVKSITGDQVVLNNVDGLTVNVGAGGNRIILWENHAGDYGNDSEVSGNVLTDKTKSWTASAFGGHQLMDSVGTEHNASLTSENTAKTFTMTLNATPMPGAYDIYQYIDRTIASLIHVDRKLRLNASPILAYSQMGQLALPVYECHFESDSLGSLEQTGEFNLESSDNYGPFWSGEISFTQAGTGT